MITELSRSIMSKSQNKSFADFLEALSLTCSLSVTTKGTLDRTKAGNTHSHTCLELGAICFGQFTCWLFLCESGGYRENPCTEMSHSSGLKQWPCSNCCLANEIATHGQSKHKRLHLYAWYHAMLYCVSFYSCATIVRWFEHCRYNRRLAHRNNASYFYSHQSFSSSPCSCIMPPACSTWSNAEWRHRLEGLGGFGEVL